MSVRLKRFMITGATLRSRPLAAEDLNCFSVA